MNPSFDMNPFSRKLISALCTGAAAALLMLASVAQAQSVEEVSGTASEVGSDYVVLSGMRFSVNGGTEYEGFSGLSDVRAGDEAEVEYRAEGGENVALGIERGAELSGTVEEVGSGSLVIGGERFSVSGTTEFEEGYARLSDVQTGDRAEVEYETRGSGKAALGVEKGGDDGEDDDAGEDDDG